MDTNGVWMAFLWAKHSMSNGVKIPRRFTLLCYRYNIHTTTTSDYLFHKRLTSAHATPRLILQTFTCQSSASPPVRSRWLAQDAPMWGRCAGNVTRAEDQMRPATLRLSQPYPSASPSLSSNYPCFFQLHDSCQVFFHFHPLLLLSPFRIVTTVRSCCRTSFRALYRGTLKLREQHTYTTQHNTTQHG
jgi:hypothetical protein